jgi:NAD(P)-dependent dehydrogenase (short-subunit alcohol dehydrogenase family)
MADLLNSLDVHDSSEGRKHMKSVIVLTGASSGFGALAARALAKAGHIVYASMRETEGRSAKQVVKEEEKTLCMQ